MDSTTIDEAVAKAVTSALMANKTAASEERKRKREEKKTQAQEQADARTKAYAADLAKRTEEKLASWRIPDNDYQGGYPPRRVVVLISGQVAHHLDRIEQALAEQHIRLFVNQGVLTFALTASERARGNSMTTDIVLSRPGADGLRETLGTVAELWSGGEESRPVDCPRDQAVMFHQRMHWPKLRELVGTTTAPTLRSDGSLLDKPGYDQASRLVYQPRPGEVWPAIPENPTEIDALAALGELGELIKDFPFVDELDRAVALSAILTAVCRPSLPLAPAYAVDATKPGTGKTEFCNVVSVFALGYPAAPVTFGHDDEFRKTLEALIIRGARCIVVDNVDDRIRSVLLNAVLTSGEVELRVMGGHSMRTCSTAAVIMMNGNSIPIEGDLTERVLKICLDAEMERPSERKFPEDAHKIAIRLRPQLVTAALTWLRAYVAAGAPPQGGIPTRFPQWGRMVRDAMLWLGLPDPVAAFQRNREADPEAGRIHAVLSEMQQAMRFHLNAFTAREVWDRADQLLREGKPGLHDALAAVAAPYRGLGSIDPRRLGKWFEKYQGRIESGLRLRRLPGLAHGGVARWRIENVPGKPS